MRPLYHKKEERTIFGAFVYYILFQSTSENLSYELTYNLSLNQL